MTSQSSATNDLTGKKILVTGASSGIGAELARAAAERGATVGICARRGDRLEAVLDDIQQHSPNSRAWTIDLADLDALDGFAADVLAEFGGLDVLVNNAGIPKRRKVQDLTFAEVEQLDRINYLSPVRLTLALLPAITAAQGDIINVSSVAARLSPPAEAAYAATKAALTAWSECMAVDLGIAGIDVRIHVVNPGVVDTELFTLPGNDAFESPVEMLPTSAMVDPVLGLIGSATFEIYVPAWFGDVVAGKFPDTGRFIAGNVEYFRAQ